MEAVRLWADSGSMSNLQTKMFGSGASLVGRQINAGGQGTFAGDR